MNAAFEDVMVLCDVIDQHNGDLAAAIPAFATQRQPDGVAIADLSMANYRVMAHHTASPLFRFRKKMEGILNWAFPDWWIPKYKMVAFTSIPYAEAIARSDAQDRAFDRIEAVVTVGVAALAAGAAYMALKRR